MWGPDSGKHSAAIWPQHLALCLHSDHQLAGEVDPREDEPEGSRLHRRLPPWSPVRGGAQEGHKKGEVFIQKAGGCCLRGQGGGPSHQSPIPGVRMGRRVQDCLSPSIEEGRVQKGCGQPPPTPPVPSSVEEHDREAPLLWRGGWPSYEAHSKPHVDVDGEEEAHRGQGGSSRGPGVVEGSTLRPSRVEFSQEACRGSHSDRCLQHWPRGCFGCGFTTPRQE